MIDYDNTRIAIIGLGYVGLPLATEFGQKRAVVGFDTNADRVEELRVGVDSTCEIDKETFARATHLSFTSDPRDLADCGVYIVSVPTPIDAHKRPDMSPLLRASETIGEILRPGNIVVYESTVYPGATEEYCVPILERNSGLTFNVDFFAGYSPERINPGDKSHRLPDICKVTSGSTPEIARVIDDLYASVIRAGTHQAPSIRVAEAAKVIENIQRDLNIALINELAIFFNRIDIDTEAVLAAAGTKWNFLPFRPGLVGGHCIGVDPYYLTHKAAEVGLHPEVILAGRRVNDRMAVYIAERMIKAMVRQSIQIRGARVLVMGLTFKENCPDLRNTKVIDTIKELQSYGVAVDVCDPWADPVQASSEFNLSLHAQPKQGDYDGVIVTVAHQEFQQMGPREIRGLCRDEGILFDLKSIFDAAETDLRL